MSRHRRYYLPGVPFHITARIALQQHLFEQTEVRDAIRSYIAESVSRCDVRVLAYCIMTNHLHLVVVQGTSSLSQFMQPILTRSAMCVHRRYGLDGRVFARKYFSNPCADAEYLRTMIVYTHLNPCRVGLVADPNSYPWSSHGLYMGARTGDLMAARIVPDRALFAECETDDEEVLVRSYDDHVRYRRHCDVCKAHDVPIQMQRPNASHGDRVWNDEYAAKIRAVTWLREHRPDLRDLAIRVVRTRMPGVDWKCIRTRGGGRILSRTRKEIIMLAAAAGHSGATIARFLSVSDAYVSRIQTSARIIRLPEATFRAGLLS